MAARRPTESDQRPSRIPPAVMHTPVSANTAEACPDPKPASSSYAATTKVM